MQFPEIEFQTTVVKENNIIVYIREENFQIYIHTICIYYAIRVIGY